MTTKFLLAAFQVPGWGGASTFTYTFFQRLQREGHAVEFLSLIPESGDRYLRDTFGAAIGNPAGLDAVHVRTLDEPVWREHVELGKWIRAQRPDLIVVCGFIAARLMKLAAPEVPLAFITSGCWQVKRLLHAGVIADFGDFERRVARGHQFAPPSRDQEHAAVVGSDLIIIHSPLVRLAYEHFFAAHMGKVYENLISIADVVYDEAAPFAHLARPFCERDIDAVFVASDWTRPEKSPPLVRQIANACSDINFHRVGYAPEPIAGVTEHGVATRREDLYAILGRSRALVCPSAFDPAPGVLFEASAMGCNVVTSPNSGNWDLCHAELLARSPEEFALRARRAIQEPLPDHRERFRGGYRDLVDTLRAFV